MRLTLGLGLRLGSDGGISVGFGGWRGDVAVEVGFGRGVGREFDELLVVDRGSEERIGVGVIVEGVDVV